MKKTLKLLVLLVLIAALSVLSTSCVLIDRVQWTYTNFQCREMTDAEKSEYGVSTLDWAPYIYTCDVEISDKLEPANGTQKGTCYFIPYVEWDYNPYYAVNNEVYPPFGHVEGKLKIREMTKIEGTGYYGKTPFELRNVEMTFLTGNDTVLDKNTGDFSYFDGSGPAEMNTDHTSAYVFYTAGRKAASEATANEMREAMQKNRLSTLQDLRKLDSLRITGMAFRMKNNNQRMTTDKEAQEAHWFGAKIPLNYDQ
ncbi:MAG: hypothetical protein IJY28_09975 [Clostridia bacterium]|nr:hypothetical protein [Clostridia bacterium]